MPKSSYLSLQEMGKILAYKDEGLGVREIGRRLNRRHGCIRNYLRDPENYGGNKKRGPKKKTSKRDEQRILREASNSSLSCKKIKTY
jgi:IS30 family transposase